MVNRHTWRDWLEVGLLVAAAPFLLFPTLSTVGLILALLVPIATGLARWRWDGYPVHPSPLNGALLLWSIGISVGTLVTAFPALTLPKATGLLLGISIWHTLVSVVHNQRAQQFAMAVLLLIGSGVVGLGLITVNWPVKVPGLATAIARIPAPIGQLPGAPTAGASANQLAGALLPYLALALSYLMDAIAPWDKAFSSGPRRLTLLLATGGAIITALLLILTQSRSAWLGALGAGGAVLLLWSIQLPRSRLRTGLRALLCLALLTVLGSTLWAGPEQLERLWEEPALTQSLGGLGTVSFRLEMWRWAIAGVQDFFFTGCGLGTFREVGRLLYPINVAPGYDYAHAHNIFLQIALDVGLPGLIAYLALLSIAAKLAWDAAKDPQQRPLALGLLAALVAWHVYGLTDALAPGSKTDLLLWYMLGLITTLQREPKE